MNGPLGGYWERFFFIFDKFNFNFEFSFPTMFVEKCAQMIKQFQNKHDYVKQTFNFSKKCFPTWGPFHKT